MSQTGTYAVQEGKVVKISDTVPVVSHRDAWMPKGDLSYFDRSARRIFHSRREKRQWLTRHHLREGGIIDPDTAP